MKLDIQELQWGWLTGNRYRVSSVEAFEMWDGQRIDIENGLYDFKLYRGYKAHRWIREIDHLRPEIREWLEASLPWGSWKSERPEKWGRHCGLRFKHKKHVVMFKLAWGGL